jgi:hypothetical protein
MRRTRIITRRVAAVATPLISLLLWLSVTLTGVAATSGGSVEEHCFSKLDPVQSGEQSSRQSPERCFPTFAEAIYAATNGAIRLDPSVQASEASEEMLRPRNSASTQMSVESTATTYVIGIDYANANYGGSSKTWTTTSVCTLSRSFQVAYVGDAWNDRISSAKSFAGCSLNPHYEHASYGGAVRYCPCQYIGDAMNDRTSSEKWRKG